MSTRRDNERYEELMNLSDEDELSIWRQLEDAIEARGRVRDRDVESCVKETRGAAVFSALIIADGWRRRFAARNSKTKGRDVNELVALSTRVRELIEEFRATQPDDDEKAREFVEAGRALSEACGELVQAESVL
jgi:hypothetical protein